MNKTLVYISVLKTNFLKIETDQLVSFQHGTSSVKISIRIESSKFLWIDYIEHIQVGATRS